jgi:uncharacterized protein
MNSLLLELNPWWNKQYELIGIKRKKYLDLLETNLFNKDIILLSGLRRVGKSTILKQLIYTLINDKKISPKNICYLSLDIYVFEDYSIRDLIKEFRKLNGLKITEKIYLFLDEITYKKSFKQELKNIYDLGNIKVFASSSSASELIDRKAHLTGRSRLIEVEPLDFQEFLEFKNYKTELTEKYLLTRYFEKYMELGGMPEYVLTEDPTYIVSLTQNIIYKDVMGKHNIKDDEIVKDLFRLLCERVGKQISYNKISNILGISNDTIKKYIGFFIDTYLFKIVEYDGKLNERIRSPKKIYCADVGIKNVVTGFRDLGSIYENLVFLKIKHENPHYVRENSIEIDFKYKDTLIEAKYNKELEGKQRELFNKLKIKNKIVAKGVDFFI